MYRFGALGKNPYFGRRTDHLFLLKQKRFNTPAWQLCGAVSTARRQRQCAWCSA
jgi:hypothetical protein